MAYKTRIWLIFCLNKGGLLWCLNHIPWSPYAWWDSLICDELRCIHDANSLRSDKKVYWHSIPKSWNGIMLPTNTRLDMWMEICKIIDSQRDLILKHNKNLCTGKQFYYKWSLLRMICSTILILNIPWKFLVFYCPISLLYCSRKICIVNIEHWMTF